MVGTRPDATVGGFMVAAALLSMWISNTATAVMLLPIGVSTVALMTQGDRTGREGSTHDSFSVVLMLGIAYACSIGGLGTLIGSPPNALLAAFMAEHDDIEIGFGRWMLVGVPLVLVSLPLTWAVLTHGLYRMPSSPAAGGLERLRRERISLGRMSRAEIMVASVFAVTASAWMLRPVLSGWVPGLSDAGIGIAAAILLFVLPVNLTKNEFVLTWDFAKTLPCEVLLLFGGGLSLANAISDTGLAAWLGQQLSGLDAVPLGVTLVVVVASIVLLTEVTSNTATAATFLPILASLAVALDHPPILLTAPAVLAASCAFMMPVATPPNAIVYGSGHVTVPQMVRAGLILNAMFIVLLSTLGTWLIRQAFV